MKKRGKNTKSKTASRTRELNVKMTPFGPSQAALDGIGRNLLQHSEVKKCLQKTRHRLLSIVPLEPAAELKQSRSAATPTHFRATIYDYTNNRTLIVQGRLAQPRKVEITDSASLPLPTREEFEEAVKILSAHEELGAAIREERLQPYPPMPPLLGEPLPDGRMERTVAVGLLPGKEEHHHEIVGVNMGRRTIIRFENNAPPAAQAHNPICGIPYANQNTASNVAGQVWITVKQGSTTLWRFLAVDLRLPLGPTDRAWSCGSWTIAASAFCIVLTFRFLMLNTTAMPAGRIETGRTRKG